MHDLQQCVRCIYDASIPGIGFAADGICSYCRQYEELDRDYPTGAAGRAVLDATVTRMKKDHQVPAALLSRLRQLSSSTTASTG